MGKKAVQFVQAGLALETGQNLVLDGIVGRNTRNALKLAPSAFRQDIDGLLKRKGMPGVDELVSPVTKETPRGKKFGPEWEEFVRAAYQVVPQYGFDPEWIIAQAALETDWGNRVPVRRDGRSSYNFGGIKSNSARQPKSGVTTKTREFMNGKWVTVDADWAVYDSASAYIHGYFDYVLNISDRYRKPRNTVGNLKDARTHDQYFSILKAGGYATDPSYVSKMRSMVASTQRRYPKEQWA